MLFNGPGRVLTLLAYNSYEDWRELNELANIGAILRADKAGVPEGPKRRAFCDEQRRLHRDELIAEGRAFRAAQPTSWFAWVMAGFGMFLIVDFLVIVYCVLTHS
jgi:hypothetical protein